MEFWLVGSLVFECLWHTCLALGALCRSIVKCSSCANGCFTHISFIAWLGVWVFGSSAMPRVSSFQCCGGRRFLPCPVAPAKRASDGSGPAPKRVARQASTIGRGVMPEASPSGGVLSGRIARAALGQQVGKEADVGLASETEAQHRRRHDPPLKNCARCVFIGARSCLEKSYGAHTNEVHGARLRTQWLTQRPARLGGSWGIGCVFCSAHAQKAAEARTQRTTPLKRLGGGFYNNSKWARFEIRALSQMHVRGVRQHGETLQHRRAARAHFLPADAATETLELSVTDEDLFRGGVPQPADWLRAWRSCRSTMSFRAGGAHGTTDNFIHGSRWSGSQSRKAFKDMAIIMATVLRSTTRATLLAATAISVGLDDRGAYRLLSFKCDVPQPPDDVDKSTWKGSASGCLGVLRRGGAPSRKVLADADDDYSQAMARSVTSAPHSKSARNHDSSLTCVASCPHWCEGREL
jgi:hypothetical protein